MKILIVAMSESVHTARWVSVLGAKEHDLHLYPSLDNGINHPQLRNIKIYHSIVANKLAPHSSVSIEGFALGSKSFAGFSRRWYSRINPNYQKRKLTQLIKKIKPDVIHSMETQVAGYLVSEVKKNFKGSFPHWIHTIWGSDLVLFSQLKEHQPKIKDLMGQIDDFICDGSRDEVLARKMGYTKKVTTVTHVAVGINLKLIQSLRKEFKKTSERKAIVIKGNQGWAGRALFALRALERCVDLLKGYVIHIYNAPVEVVIAAELFENKNGIKINIIPLGAISETILKIFGSSRIYIGMSIGDGIPTSMLEAMSVGTFPIQSNTGILESWIIDGKTGCATHPEEPIEIEKALRKALEDDDFVDSASIVNSELIDSRFNTSKIFSEVQSIYSEKNV